MNTDEIAAQVSNAFSGQDTVSLIIILIILAVVGSFVIKSVRKISSYVGLIIAGLILFEMLHIAAFYTEIGTWLPFTQTVFKWNPISAIAAPFAETAFADICARCEAMLIVAISKTVELCVYAYNMIMPSIRGVFIE